MNKLHLVILLIILAFNLYANESGTYLYQEVDITPVVNLFSKNVKSLTKEVKVFHWDNSARSGTNSRNLMTLKQMSEIYWKKYGNNGEGSMLGDGLYLAIDPIITNGYGLSPNWSLLTLNLPVGLTILDIDELESIINYNNTDERTLSIIKSLSNFNCNSFSRLSEFFYGAGATQPPECQNLIKYIFINVFKIDIIAYSYFQANNYTCTSYFQKAFILTNARWIQAGMYQFYNKNSQHNKTERIEIQSLFLYEKDKSYYLGKDFNSRRAIKDKLKEVLLQNPNKSITNSFTECSSENCKLKIKLCEENQQNCEDLTLIEFDKSNNTKITSELASFARRRQQSIDDSYLVWKGLDGESLSTNTDQWAKESIFGCDGIIPLKTKTQ